MGVGAGNDCPGLEALYAPVSLVGGRAHQHIPRDCCGDAAAFLVRLASVAPPGPSACWPLPGPWGSGRSRPCAAGRVTSGSSASRSLEPSLTQSFRRVAEMLCADIQSIRAPSWQETVAHSVPVPFYRGGARHGRGDLSESHTGIQVSTGFSGVGRGAEP